MATEMAAPPLTLDEFEKAVVDENIMPLWLGRPGREPRPKMRPYLWTWRHLRSRILQSGELMPLGAKGAERRSLTLRNPGFPLEKMGTTQTFVCAIQMIHGTEKAPSHRHTAAALRFIKEGQGACTVVNGEPESMNVGDLLLTPNWYWHGHFSEHDQPMIWMDCLDVPLVAELGAMFQEEYPGQERDVQSSEAPRDESIRRYAAGGLLPVGEDRRSNKNSPLLNFRWAETEEQLHRMKDRDGSPYDGAALEYTSPFHGGPVMPTIDCWIQMLRPGERTKAHRHTGSVVYNVVRGTGWTVIDGQRFDWAPGDILCIPSWAVHEHANASDTEGAVLFSANDSPVLQALDLYREEPYGDGGHQAVTSTFEALV